MRAWRAHGFGAPGAVLRLDQLEPPRPGPAEVVVELEAAALNFADVLVLKGLYQERSEPPFTPGFDLAGRVVSAGAAAQLRPGTRVVGLAEPPEGSFQELVKLPAARVHAIPDSMPVALAGSFHVAFGTALVGLERRGGLRPGETLLVLGAAGAVGSAAVQVGCALGARVIAVAGGGAKLDACRRLGADLVVDHRSDDVVAAVMGATGGRGADVVFDPVGGELFDRARRCLAFEGRLLVAGFASGVPSLELNRPLLGNFDVAGLYFARYAERHPDVVAAAHRRLLDLYSAGAIRAIVREKLRFEELPRGFRLLEERDSIGRVVLVGPAGRCDDAIQR